MILEKDCDNKSSNINEVISEIISNFSLQKDFTHKKKHKKHKIQISDFYSDIFICLKSIKKEASDFHS